MDEKLLQQHINLDSFARDQFLYAVDRLRTAVKNLRQEQEVPAAQGLSERLRSERVVYAKLGDRVSSSKAWLWELYCWMQLGASIEYFDRTEVVDFVSLYFEDFPEFDEAYSEVGDLIPGRLLIGLRSTFGRRQKYFTFDLGYGVFQRRAEMHPLLSSILLLHGGFAKDVVVRATIEALAFSDGELWKLYMADDVVPEDVVNALSDSNTDAMALNKATLVAGLFKIVAYLGEFRGLSERPWNPKDMRYGPTFKEETKNLMHWAKEICFWRINFVRRDYRRRFLELGKFAANYLMSSVNEAVVNEQAKHGDVFLNELEGLIDFWTGDVEMEVAGGANA